MEKTANRGKLAFTLLAYIYWPVAYFGVYLPFVVPSLGRWKQIPVWIPIIMGLGFVLILVSMGIHNSQKANFLHAIGIQISLLFFLFLMVKLVMPGFKKSEYGANGRFLEDLIVLVAPIMIMFAVAEGGRILLTKKDR